MLQIAGIHNQRTGGEIAKQRRQRLVEEQRLPVFDPGRQGTFAYLLVDMFRIALHVKAIAPLAAEQFDRRLVGWELMRRQQIDGLDFFQSTLAINIE